MAREGGEGGEREGIGEVGEGERMRGRRREWGKGRGNGIERSGEEGEGMEG